MRKFDQQTRQSGHTSVTKEFFKSFGQGKLERSSYHDDTNYYTDIPHDCKYKDDEETVILRD